MLTLFMVMAVALCASLLTLFSGFGLGTIMLPVLAIFFPLHLAVSMTAVVHLLNNVFKFVLMGRAVDWRVVKMFGLPALLAAAGGAWLLGVLAAPAEVFQYSILDRTMRTSLINVILGGVMVCFAIFEGSGVASRLSVSSKWISAGGLLSGFFGGLSGHQGAFRSIFLIRLNLSQKAFVATGVVIAVLVDVMRLTVYGVDFDLARYEPQAIQAMVGAIAASFAGAYWGSRLLTKVTVRGIQILVGGMLGALGVGFMLGII